MEIFYAPPEDIRDRQIRLGPDEARHIARVLRHDVGEHILVVDGRGTEYRCIIRSIDDTGLTAEVISRTRRVRENIAEVTLAAAAIKGRHFDTVVEMATELGVARIVPLITERTVARVGEAKLSRFRALARAALKSSTRTMLPEVVAARTFSQFLDEEWHFDWKLIAWEDERQASLRHLPRPPKPLRVALVIGPEGGFTPDEVELARNRGFQPFSLGPRRLRAQTACIAALSVVLYELREF